MKKFQLSVLSLIMLSVLFLGCEKSLFFVEGKGDIVKQTLTLSDFSAIESNEALNVVITQGDGQEVTVEGHQNIIDRLKLNVDNKTWDIEFEHGNYRNYELTVYITIPTLTDVTLCGSGNITINAFQGLTTLGLAINGSGNIENTENISAENISIDIAGSGSCELNANATKIESSISGSGDISLSGIISNQIIEIIGSGKYLSFNCLSESIDVAISGSGDAEVSAKNLLDVAIAGSGNVYYKGTPSINVDISGSGSVISRN